MPGQRELPTELENAIADLERVAATCDCPELDVAIARVALLCRAGAAALKAALEKMGRMP